MRFQRIARAILPLLMAGPHLWAPAAFSEETSGNIAYVVIFEGVEDKGILSEMEMVADSVSLRERPPGTLGLLRRRMEKDIGRLKKVLEAEGYYGAQVEGEIDSHSSPVRVVFRTEMGKPFVLGSVDIIVEGDEAKRNIAVPAPADLGL